VSEFARIAVVALLFVLAQSPQGTQLPTSSQQPPRFRGGTNLVRVDVLATKNGVPVQDLTADDLEVFEDGAPQKIENFEHIVIESTPGALRADPSSVSQAIQQAGDPHRRVFVIYLDDGQVTVAGSANIKEPLIDFMNRGISDDDLVGVMTPDMGPQQITFGRKTDIIARGLRDNWIWGRGGDYIRLDDREKLYDMCFPSPPQVSPEIPLSPLAKEMIDRRRERMVLDSLADLAHYMEAIRDGRTAVVTVSDGWVLYKPDPTMLIPRKNADGSNRDPMPGAPPPVGVGRGGTLMTRPENTGTSSTTLDRTECDKDRYTLANLQDDTDFRNIIGEANRANVSFYTIDPRGLVATECTMCPNIAADRALLKVHHDSLADLATGTDGLLVVESNDLHQQLRRIADDLASYYLFGYYSTDPKLDGRYRTIKVRSKRPGIEVRARPGYRAASAAEVNAARAATDLPVSEEKAAITRALAAIESDARAQGRVLARGPGEPALFHRGPSTGNQLQPATARIFPRSDRLHLEAEAAAAAPVWTGALLDRNGTKTVVPVVAGERTDAATGQGWLTADVTLAPLGAGDYVIELITTAGTEQRRTLVAIRVTQ
jgi:VWFA-related protein